MTKTERAYIDLLRHALWGKTVDSCSVSPRELVCLANVQKTRPLILDILTRSGIAVDETLRGEIENFIVKSVSSHLLQDRLLSTLVLALRKSGINAVLLKGEGLANCYPSLYLRECGDIDLYVDESDYKKACEIVREEMDGDNILEELESDKHFLLRKGEMIVEIHHHTLSLQSEDDNAFFETMSKDGLSRNLVQLNFCGVPVYTPADSFNAFYIFLHAWEHFKGRGLGLRHLCDWAIFLHVRHEHLDLDVIKEALDKMDLWKAWQAFAGIAVDILGLPADEMPFYTPKAALRARRILNIMFREGDLGKFRHHMLHRRKDYFGRKIQSLWALSIKCFHILFIFPDVAVSIFRTGVSGGINKLHISTNTEANYG